MQLDMYKEKADVPPTHHDTTANTITTTKRAILLLLLLLATPLHCLLTAAVRH